LLGKQRARTRRLRRSTVRGVAAVAAVALVGLPTARALSTPSLQVTGPSHEARIGLAGLAPLSFATQGNARTLRQERWALDGVDVTARVRVHEGDLVFRPME